MAKWIICSGMIRSGSTLQYQLVQELLAEKKMGSALGYLNGKDLLTKIVSEKESDNYYLVKCHDYIDLPEEIHDANFKFIYSYRDIRDVIVSIMQKENKKFSEVLSPYNSNLLLENQREQENKNNILISGYDDLVLNLPEEIKRIIDFLNINIEKSSFIKLSEKYALENQKKKLLNTDFLKDSIQKYGATYSKDSLFHPNHINSGKSNQYKQYLSNIEIARIQKIWGKWIMDHGYSIHKTIYNNKIVLKFGIILYQIKKNGILKYLKEKLKKYKIRISNWFKKRNSNLIINSKDYKIKQLDSGTKIKLYKDSFLSDLIFKDEFEVREQEFIKSFLKKGNTFLDIGANIGLFTLLASKVVGDKGKVFSFEPSSKTFDRLNENIKINNFENCYPQNIALSNENGVTSIKLSKEGYDAWNSLAKPTIGSIFFEEKISMLTLDSFIKENNIEKVDFIKIDVEGWEVNVLKGAKKFLSNYNPAIIVEVAQDNLLNAGFSVKDLFNILEEYGYKLFRINPDLSLEPEEKKDSYQYVNLVALKNPIS